MWCTHLTWKMLGQPAPKCRLSWSKTMMLVNVCACFDVMISHGWPANLPRRCSFFLSVSLLFSFSFFFFTMLLALSVFLLTRTNVELKSYNLNRFAKPTRCHPFNSFLQQTGVIICMVVILFATRGSTPLKKMIMMKKLSRKAFIETAACTAAKGREESFKRWGKRRTHGIFSLSSRLQHRVLVHIFQVLLTIERPANV